MLKINMQKVVREFADNYKEEVLKSGNLEICSRFLLEGLAMVDDVFEQAAFYTAFKEAGLMSYIDEEWFEEDFWSFIKKLDKLQNEIINCESSHMKFLELAILKLNEESSGENQQIDLETEEGYLLLMKALHEALGILYGYFVGYEIRDLLSCFQQLRTDEIELYEEHLLFIVNHVKERIGVSLNLDGLLFEEVDEAEVEVG